MQIGLLKDYIYNTSSFSTYHSFDIKLGICFEFPDRYYTQHPKWSPNTHQLTIFVDGKD
ncbi:MAG: hypothetical protein H3C54_10385 [Taibaiella sp.]|nr:hypothetical protein [Taibaiella sp.]